MSEAGLKPNMVVIVATIKALKYHGKVKLENIKEENVEALASGVENLAKHIDTAKQFNLPYVIAINKFNTDDAEVNLINGLKKIITQSHLVKSLQKVVKVFRISSKVIDNIKDE